MVQRQVAGNNSVCWICEEDIASPFTCSKCRKPFHAKSCGHVPTITEYARADPDDLARGQWGGGAHIVMDPSQATCGVCTKRFPKDRDARLALFQDLKEHEARKNRVESLRVEDPLDTSSGLTDHASDLMRIESSLLEIRVGLEAAQSEHKAIAQEAQRKMSDWRQLGQLLRDQHDLNRRIANLLSIPLEEVVKISTVSILCDHLNAVRQIAETNMRQGREWERRIEDLRENENILSKQRDEYKSD